MQTVKKIHFLIFSMLLCGSLYARTSKPSSPRVEFQLGIEQTERYMPLLQGKRVGIVANQTSLIQGVHLLDTLLARNIQVVKIFSPEHGFRGEAEAGKYVDNSIDAKTALPIISLYGVAKKPIRSQFDDVDIIVFDIQDVGARFYTYISTMHNMMEVCADFSIPLLILDRPNPHGFYVDGPILDSTQRSFVGMHPVPIVHGMTLAEYARMINGENWLSHKKPAPLITIEMKAYTHAMDYQIPIPPSPNLRSMEAIYAYPSLCLFEGTPISVGRGTLHPFEQYGFPNSPIGQDTFTPTSIRGLSVVPLYNQKRCTGFSIPKDIKNEVKQNKQLNLSYLIRMYQAYPEKDKFFKDFFNRLAGTTKLKEQIQKGLTEEQIRASWQADLEKYKRIREKYLLYP
ncbi:MAG: DUF1343 domain-containing protein [Bacteroidales bacterium]